MVPADRPVVVGQSVTSPGVGARARFMSRLVRPSTLPLWFGFVVAVCFIAAETLLLYPLKRVAPVGGLAVVYLVGIVAIAIVWGWWLAALTSVASALTFDFFHTPPLYSVSLFTLHRADDWVAMVAFLTMALVASALTDLARWRAAEADQRRREAEASRDQLSVLATQQAALRRVATLVARGGKPAGGFRGGCRGDGAMPASGQRRGVPIPDRGRADSRRCLLRRARSGRAAHWRASPA